MMDVTPNDIAGGLHKELRDVIYRYHDSILTATVLGVLDMLKYDILVDNAYSELNEGDK